MRSFNRLQRGSTNWPFVIVLLALLVFVYMWWDSQDGRDADKKNIAKLKETNSALLEQAVADRQRERAVAMLVGFREEVPANQALGLSEPGLTVNLETLRQHLLPEGVVVSADASMDGTMSHLIKTSSLRWERERRIGEPTGDAKEYKYKTMSPELKKLLEDLADDEVPARPLKPGDPDDADAQRRYEDELAAYKEAFDAWRSKIREAVSGKGYDEYADTITLYGVTSPDDQQLVELLFAHAPAATTVEAVFAAIRDIPSKMKAEIETVTQAEVAEVKRLAGEIAELKTELKTKQDEITAGSETYGNDMAEKEAKIQGLQEAVSDAEAAKATAQNELARARDDFMNEKAKVVAKVRALEEGFRIVKQRQDLKIRRDEPDGEIVAANNVLHTATIDRGFAEKVHVGQRFNVSALDRAGDRITKGQIMIVKVTGQHSSRVRITQAWDTITGGDFIHNPLYSPTDQIHVYFAGPLAKWPKDMARGRLAKQGVILQDKITGDTDYIVVPNSWAVAADIGAGEDDGEDEEEMTGGKTPLEEMESRARVVGAKVITERLLDSFLAY